MSVTTIVDRYHYGLTEVHRLGDQARDCISERNRDFECLDEENTAALPRDAFTDEELIKLIKLPLFTGSAGSHRIWKQGKYFLQDPISTGAT